MIRFTLRDGSLTSINPAQVFSIAPVDGGTIIWSAYASQVQVTEPFEAVEKTLTEWCR